MIHQHDADQVIQTPAHEVQELVRRGFRAGRFPGPSVSEKWDVSSD